MKLSISNIALPQYSHVEELGKLVALGFLGLEVAPSRTWGDTWHGLKKTAVDAYRRDVEGAGLQIVGLHSLLFDQPSLGLFGNPRTRANTLDFLVHLSGLCQDLGGRTLIFGGGRRRGNVDEENAKDMALQFLSDYVSRTAGHGTCLCFEPLGPKDTDFINSAHESLELVRQINHPAFRVQLDAKALAANDEQNLQLFKDCAPWLVHYHANEPGFLALGDSGEVDHVALGRYLTTIGYKGWVSIEQRMLETITPIDNVKRSISMLRKAYGA